MGNENQYEGFDTYAIKLVRHKARRLVGRAGFVEADRHDLEQELMLDLLRRLPRFDSTLAKRETFIARVVEHQVATLIEAQKAGVRDYRRCAGSLDEITTDEDSSPTGMPRILDLGERHREAVASAHRDEDLQALRMDLNKVLAGLSIDLQALCIRLQTANVTEISRQTGVSRGTLYETLRKLRTCFDRAGVGAYLRTSDRSRRAPVGNP